MAITELYVSAAGGGAHDGTSEANAYSITEIVTAWNVPATAGTRFNLKQGSLTGLATITLTGDGTATSPLILRGYNSTIGDLDAQGRSSGGALNTTNFPDLQFNSTAVFSANGANFAVFQNLKITGSANAALMQLGQNNSVTQCAVVNSSTGASAIAISDNGNGSSELIDCDASTTGASGTLCAVDWRGGNGYLAGCRAKSVVSSGFRFSSTNQVVNCTAYECGTDGFLVNSTTSACSFTNCTSKGNASDGLSFLASTTALTRIVNCMFTDNGAYGIEFNGSTAMHGYGNNVRFRDNTSGAYSTAPDWFTAAALRIVTTDTGGDTTDYTDPSTDDFSLIAASPAINQGVGYLVDIGANGTPVVSGGAGGLLRHPGMSGGLR